MAHHCNPLPAVCGVLNCIAPASEHVSGPSREHNVLHVYSCAVGALTKDVAALSATMRTGRKQQQSDYCSQVNYTLHNRYKIFKRSIM
jgi:hypothetical protein